MRHISIENDGLGLRGGECYRFGCFRTGWKAKNQKDKGGQHEIFHHFSFDKMAKTISTSTVATL
jgi:hypothetical protein